MKRYQAIAEYYDFEYAQMSMLERDVPLFLRHLPKKARAGVLEIASGTGRAAIPIAQAGHRVVGVDCARDMIQIACRKRDAVDLKSDQCRFVIADALKLNLRRRFDAACIFFNTFLNFTTLAEQDRLLRTIRRHLKPRGMLWIDVFNPSMAMLSEQNQRDIDPVIFHVPRYDRTVQRTTDVHRADPTNQVQRVTFRYRWIESQSLQPRIETMHFDMTWIHARELRMLLERNGFAIEKIMGDYDGSRLSDQSERIIVLARRDGSSKRSGATTSRTNRRASTSK